MDLHNLKEFQNVVLFLPQHQLRIFQGLLAGSRQIDLLQRLFLFLGLLPFQYELLNRGCSRVFLGTGIEHQKKFHLVHIAQYRLLQFQRQ